MAFAISNSLTLQTYRNDRKLRTAFLHITNWEQYYNTNTNTNVTASKKKVVFVNSK